jgi:hypothetical protein
MRDRGLVPPDERFEAGYQAGEGAYDDQGNEKAGHYPGCKSSRKTQHRQQSKKNNRMRRKHASAAEQYMPWILAGIVKRAAAEKCGCGCTDCAACGTKEAGGAVQKVKVQRPETRTGKGQFAWTGRGATDLRDDPMYDHFGTPAGALGAKAAALALSGPG